MNPLPNLVSAHLLAKQNASICLLYSDGKDGGPASKSLAENLEQALNHRRPDLTVSLEGIASSDNVAITQRLNKILNCLLARNKNASIGLNYTGATKPMAVHVYRSIEQTLKDRTPPPVFSYLDPRKIALRIDGSGASAARLYPVLQSPPLRQQVALTLDELAALHGYQRDSTSNSGFTSSAETPELAKLSAKLAELFSSDLNIKDWQKWMRKTELDKLPLRSEKFGVITAALDDFCGGEATPDCVAAKLRPEDEAPELKSCAKWFNGLWLEEYASGALEAAAKAFGLEDFGKNPEYRAKVKAKADKKSKADKFELDAAAMMGYRLFVVSVKATSKKESAKEHLLEAYVRARQLGGDEARVGLVCLYPDAKFLEKEIARSWDEESDRIKVFGKTDLKNLKENFSEWFKKSQPAQII